MAGSTTQVRIQLDAAQAKATIDSLSKSTKSLTEEFNKLTSEGNWQGAAQVASILNQNQQTIGGLSRQVNAQSGNSIAGQLGKMFAPMAIAQQITSAGDSYFGYRKSLAQGDAVGAGIAKEKFIGETRGEAIGAAIGAGIGSVAPGIGTVIGLGIGAFVGKWIGGIGAKISEENMAFFEQYRATLADADKLQQRFGGSGNELWQKAADASKGTGLSVSEFSAALANSQKYGYMGIADALPAVRRDVMWSRMTGADIGEVQNVSGTARRFGAGDNAVQTAFAALKTQRMANGQFGEILRGMSKVMEDGIRKGFVYAADDIGSNMTLLYKMSGGSPLWQGEQGVQRLMGMNNAIAGATELSSVEDMITFGQAQKIVEDMRPEKYEALMGSKKTGTYVDTMRYMERGFDPKLFMKQMEMIESLDSGNVAGQIERMRSMYGLNYQGATQLYDMRQRHIANPSAYTEAQLQKDLDAVKMNPSFNSDSTNIANMTNAVQSINTQIGQMKLDEWNNYYEAALSKLRSESDNMKADSRIKEYPELVAMSGPTLTPISDVINYKNIDENDMGEEYVGRFLKVLNEGKINENTIAMDIAGKFIDLFTARTPGGIKSDQMITRFGNTSETQRLESLLSQLIDVTKDNKPQQGQSGPKRYFYGE